MLEADEGHRLVSSERGKQTVAIYARSTWRWLKWSAAAEVKIGLLHALSGSMQSRETPLYLAELIAIEEINARGGLLGRMVEPSAGSRGLAAYTLRPVRGSTR